MLYANFHTHTPLCMHAWGDEEAYVRTAMERGVRVLGFSDHTPHRFRGGLLSSTRMTPEELPLYCERILALKEKYRDKLDIHLGLETECYTGDGFDKTLALYEGLPIEYMICGQHTDTDEVAEGTMHFFRPYDTSDRSLELYFERLHAALDTGRYTYLAHPDFLYHENRALYETRMRELLLRAKREGVPVELNMIGITGKRHYHSPLYLRLLGETGCPTVIGCDAHAPEHVADPDALSLAARAIREHGITMARTLDLINPLTRERKTVPLYPELLFAENRFYI